MGTFFWDYSIDSYSGIRITEHTEYQFPKEQTLCYSENRIADVTKIKAMRQRKSSHQNTGENCQKNMITGYSEQTTIPSILLSGAELTEYYFVHSGIRIGPRRTQLPPILCILIPKQSQKNAPKDSMSLAVHEDRSVYYCNSAFAWMVLCKK